MGGRGRTLIWVIDDLSENQEMVRRSLFPHGEAYLELEGFLEARVSLAEMAARAAGAGAVPEIILMDYFLDSMTGAEVTVQMRSLLHDGARPVIIGHSSVTACSRAIVAAGGDFVLPKPRGRDTSSHLLEVFSSRERVRELLRRRGDPRD